MFTKKTIRDIDLQGKTVLLRADYNEPEKNGKISDDYRIKKSLPTVKYILDQPGAKLVIISHLGRPKDANDKEFSLKSVAVRLGELLDKKVQFAPDCIGEQAKKAATELGAGGVLLLENVRFHPQEEANDKDFAQAIVDATGADVFVQDGFGVVHRKHATTDAIAHLLPSVAGLLVEKEVDVITDVMSNPTRPWVTVVGGAKISDKVDFLNQLIDKADCVAVVGAIANNFLLAEGFKMGSSMVEPEAMDITLEVLERARIAERERNFHFMIPVDVVVSKRKDGLGPTRIVDLASHSIDDIEAYPKKPEHAAYTIASDEMMLDIGPVSAAYVAGAIKMSNTVVWNGTAGITEVAGIGGAAAPYTHGTQIIVSAMMGASNRHKNKSFTLVGGGDTAAYVEGEGLVDDFSHVSTGGGASLDLMAGRPLPGVDVLQDK